MAIPTMFHSSSSILEAQAMAYLAEDTSSSGSEGGPDPLIHIETKALSQETGTAWTEGEQGLEFSPFRVEHRLPQSQHSSSSSEALKDACSVTRSLRKHHKEHKERNGDGRERRKKCNALGQQRWRDRSVKKSQNCQEERQKRATPPMFSEQEHKPKTCNNSRPQSTVKVISRPEYESQEQGTSLASRFSHKGYHLESQAAGLCLHGLKVGCCLDIYSSNGGSCSTELNSDPESVYIYAESIKACDSTFCSILQERNSIRLWTDAPQTSFEHGCYKTGDRQRGGACKLKSRLETSDSNLETLCLYTEEKLSFDLPDYSTEAVMGSDYSCRSFGDDCDSDNSSVCVEWDRSFDSGDAEDSVDSLDSLAEAQWGSVSSRLSSGSCGSCYTMDCGSEFSYCTVERSSISDFEGLDCCSIPADHFDKDSYDLYNAWTETTDIDVIHYASQETNDEKNYSLNELRGAVTQTDRCHVSLFFREMVKEAAQVRDQEKLNASEGFLFHPQQFLQAKNSKYREGREYSLLRHIQNGSYGDVFSVRDKQTGFTCAAKRIPLCSFSWEEVGTWSRLDSPHVLQLYGAVREGLNIVLFMDLKTGSLAQLLKARGSLSEDLALFYHSQVLQALEHLHSRQVIHLDVKVDNVLLSKDGRECFLCDFGLSEMLDQTGFSTKTLRGNGLRGTESHMSPEVARGDPRSDKADVWSSCCMLLHMLSGHQPWTRYYTHPLCLKIVSEPAPLWEIPPCCDPLTCEIIRGGLVKNPRERDSARELLEKTTKALQADVSGVLLGCLRVVGGCSDPVLYHLSDAPELQECPPKSLKETPDLVAMTTKERLPSVSTISAPTMSCQEVLSAPRIEWVSTWRERAEEEDETDSEGRESDEESEWDNEERTNDMKRDQMRAWMERYWETGEDSITRQQTLSLDEMECQREREDEDIYTDVKKVWAKEENQKQHGENRAESDEMGDTNGMMDGILEERGLYEGKTGSPLTEAESASDGDDADEQEVSDLESLRELGSDWTEEEWEPFHRLQILYGTKAQQTFYFQSEDDTEEESLASTTPSGQTSALCEQNSKSTLICHHSTCASEPELTDKNSVWSDDLSSGVFSSYSSLTDGQSFNVDWLVSTSQPPSCCFEGLGVDIWVEDVSGETLRIRERLKVKLGHVAVGISAQISMRTFSLATLDGKLVSPDTEVSESGMWLQCIPAPDGSTSWDWRVRDGKLEKKDNDDGASDTCSTIAA